MSDRHANLYDLHRWRRYRGLAFIVGTVGVVMAVITTVRGQLPASNTWLLVGVTSYSLAGSLWLRQRFSQVWLEDDRLVIRIVAARQRLEVGRIRRIRAGKLLAAFERPERRRYAPRPAQRWRDAEAVFIRLREPDDGRLRRILGRRCVFEDEVILPVTDAAGLCREVEARISPAAEPGPRSHRAGHRGRRRR